MHKHKNVIGKGLHQHLYLDGNTFMVDHHHSCHILGHLERREKGGKEGKGCKLVVTFISLFKEEKGESTPVSSSAPPLYREICQSSLPSLGRWEREVGEMMWGWGWSNKQRGVEGVWFYLTRGKLNRTGNRALPWATDLPLSPGSIARLPIGPIHSSPTPHTFQMLLTPSDPFQLLS